MRNVSYRSCIENQNTHFMFINFFYKPCAVYDIMWKNIVHPGRPQLTIWHMCIACCATKATDTQPECVVLIAFPLQQWLHEPASVLYFTYIACLLLVSWILAHNKPTHMIVCRKGQGKAKVAPVHALKACWGSRGIAPLILNWSASWKWVVSITLQLLYPR
jgi:hypothetical protein